MGEPSTSLNFEVAQGAAAFGDHGEWNAMVADAAGGSFFQTAQWCVAWADHLVTADELAVARVRAGARLIGGGALAALALPVFPRLGLSARAVTNVGTGRGAADHSGFPILRNAPEETVDLLWEWATHWRPERTLLLANLDRETAIDARAGHELQPVDGEQCPLAIVPADVTFDEVRATWTKNRRKTIGKKLRDFSESGGQFAWIDDPQALVDALPIVFRLHLLRRRELGRSTTFGETAESRAFHTQLASYADPVSGCWVQLATVGGDVVGALYGFRLGATYSVYQSGWDPAWGPSSLGLIQYAEAFRHVVEARGTRLDMCRGIDPYKLRFATEVRAERSYARLQGIGGRLLSARWAARRARRGREGQSTELSSGLD